VNTSAKSGKTTTAATSGIDVEFVALHHCVFEDRLFQHVTQGLPISDRADEEGSVELAAEVRVYLDPEETSGLVELVITAEPEAQPSWRASVGFVGKYSVVKDLGETSIPFSKFVWSNGIAYLVPYVRERLANLTSASAFPSYHLPPLSVPKLLELAEASRASVDKDED
jgi:preprotein translocase subunit SecB